MRRSRLCSSQVDARKKPKSHEITEDVIVGEDQISKLPDEILVEILSLLTKEEAARSGTISRRWATLWTRIPAVLKFGTKETIDGLQIEEEDREIEASKFIRRVNQIIGSYRGQALDEFSVCFDLDRRDKSDIDKWIQFAFANKVRKFELAFCSYSGEEQYKYSLPSFGYQKKLRSRAAGFSCTSLTAIRLDGVNVTREHIEYFLSNCRSLESLSVISSDTIGNGLKVDGPIQLKHLELIDCTLQNLEISIPNLTSLKYESASKTVINMPQKYPSRLVEMSAGGSLYECLFYKLPSFTSYLHLLETLTLSVTEDTLFKDHDSKWPMDIPILTNLKQLTLRVAIDNEDSLMGYTSWIEASPFLRKFVLEIQFHFPDIQREAKAPKKCLHQNLKEVEFLGFVGETVDSELITYVIENAVNLDKIVFDCRKPGWRRNQQTRERRAAKARAKQFQPKLKPTVDFVLIP